MTTTATSPPKVAGDPQEDESVQGEAPRKRQRTNGDFKKHFKELYRLFVVPQAWLKPHYKRNNDNETNWLFLLPKENYIAHLRTLLSKDKFVEEIRSDALDTKLSDPDFDRKYGQLFEPPAISSEYNSGSVEWGQTWPVDEDGGCYFSTIVRDYSASEENPRSSLVRVINPKPGMPNLVRFKWEPETDCFSWEVQKDLLSN